MAENRAPVRRNDVIHCENCGEDYSVTYKRCPFCDEMQSQPGRTSGTRGGGKRVANARGGGYGGGPDFDLLRIIGIVVPLVLIVAALYIIITVLGPMITAGREEPSIDNSTPPSESVSGAVESDKPEVSPSEPVVVTPVPGDITGITLDKSDFTLAANESYTIKATVAPADAQGTVTWSVDNASAASITQDGRVTNTNAGASTVTVTVTASSGDVSATCLVRCKPGGTASASPQPSQSGSGTSSSGSLSAGPAVIADAGTGLRVRSGPGTSYEVLASLINGNQVNIVESAGDGWYKITFTGGGGSTVTGYVLGEYLSQN